ncbi:MAG: dCTP deaminase [Planctomycetota bacterium]
MILTDREIELAIRNNRLRIDPPPPSEAYSATAVDLTLAAEAYEWPDPVTGANFELDPGKPGFSYQELRSRFSKPLDLSGDGFSLKTHKFLLAWTRERVVLPVEAGIAARVEGKSSLARLGISVHVTAPTIHAGFEGAVQLEVFNHGPNPVRLRAGMKVCQLIFELTWGTPSKAYAGQFLKQSAENQRA